MKYCNFCNKDLDESNFNKEIRNRDGLNTKCKLCTRKYFNNYIKVNKLNKDLCTKCSNPISKSNR